MRLCGSIALAIAIGASLVATTAAAQDSHQARIERGITLALEGHHDDAHRVFALLLAEDPSGALGLNNAANVYLLEGRPDRALDLYARALEVEPQNGGIQLNLGIAHHVSGDREESLRWLRRGLLRIDDTQRAYYLLGLSASSSSRRAKDEEGLRESEIEALLAEALEDLPDHRAPALESAAASDSVGGENVSDSDRVVTRAGGTRASNASESDMLRLYWMGIERD